MFFLETVGQEPVELQVVLLTVEEADLQAVEVALQAIQTRQLLIQCRLPLVAVWVKQAERAMLMGLVEQVWLAVLELQAYLAPAAEVEQAVQAAVQALSEAAQAAQADLAALALAA
jgi:hypothetical protein